LHVLAKKEIIRGQSKIGDRHDEQEVGANGANLELLGTPAGVENFAARSH
jgi:hypothetical protein